MTFDTLSEAIALSSPSGRQSKRSREAAIERLRVALFGEEGLRIEAPNLSVEQMKEHAAKRCADLRHYAECGFKPRSHLKLALEIEKLIATT